MPSDVFELFRRAIAEKKQVVFDYQGLRREACPHTLGYKHGNEHALVFQFAGQSSRGLPPGGEWRCVDLHGVAFPMIREGQWHTAPNHSRPQTCVDQIVEEVVY